MMAVNDVPMVGPGYCVGKPGYQGHETFTLFFLTLIRKGAS